MFLKRLILNDVRMILIDSCFLQFIFRRVKDMETKFIVTIEKVSHPFFIFVRNVADIYIINESGYIIYISIL